MVYCGKPSKGCSNCRQRRIKCDQVVPKCSQCLRSGKACAYRDLLNLSFRSENDKIIQKVGGASAWNVSKSRWEISTPETGATVTARAVGSSTAESYSPTRSTTFVNIKMISSVEDLGVRFVFTNYIATSSKALVEKRDQSPLPLPVWPRLFVDESFFRVVSSVGYAGLANVTKDKNYAIIAQGQYAKTVNIVKKTLRDPSGANLGDIVPLILFMAVFEIISSKFQDNGNWAMHVDGAAALLTTMGWNRGPRRAAIPIRQHIPICLLVFIECLDRKRSAPPAVTKWSQSCTQMLDTEDAPAAAVAGFFSRLTATSAAATRDTPTNAANLVEQAHTLENDMRCWQENVQTSWKFTLSKVAEPSENIYDKTILNYRDVWTTRIWNDFRLARILVNEFILNHSSHFQLNLIISASRQDECISTITKMAREICCSVSNDILGRDDDEGCATDSPSRLTCCFFTLHPLSVAAGAIGVHQETHDWAIRRLDGIGRRMGIQQALNLAETARRTRADWLRDYPWFM